MDEDWILASADEYGGGVVRSSNALFEIDSPGVILISSRIDFSSLFRAKWEKITFSDFYYYNLCVYAWRIIHHSSERIRSHCPNSICLRQLNRSWCSLKSSLAKELLVQTFRCRRKVNWLKPNPGLQNNQ